jgi:tyrosyl-tRNA synthetase
MKVPDTVLGDYFRLTTDIMAETYEKLIAADIREAHAVYAQEIVTMYHGKEAAASAECRYREVASGALPENMDAIKLLHKEISIIELIKEAGFAESNSDARRLIFGGGIKLDGVTATDSTMMISGKSEIILSRGKNRFVRVLFS